MVDIKILVVEDDEAINSLLYKILTKEGYCVTSAYSGSEGRMCMSMSDYDLVILDLMLPGLTGEELIEKVRRVKTMPVIIISAKAELNDRVNLLKLGADDYITKPFEVKEVLARVEAQLRRYKVFSNVEGKKKKLIYKELVLDKDAVKVTVKNREIILTGKEFAILELLMAEPEKVFTRESLYIKIWNNEFYGEDNTVNVHVSNIRNKIAKIDKDTEYIKTVWGLGFKMAE